MKIKYEFVTGETVEVEVTESISKVAIELDRAIKNSDRRETRRHNSVEALGEKGTQLSDGRVDIPLVIEQQEMRETLHNAMDKLLPRQRELIYKVFFDGRTMADIAREEGVTAKAVQDRVNKMKARLKKIIENNLF
jgi:RNA polymerase sigma-70 factor (ECF subfamily)